MPIPDYQTLMLPLLNLLQDGKDRTKIDAVSQLADEFHLSDEERNERFTNSDGNVFHSRVSWARTFLKQAGLVTYPKRGSMQITPRGLSVLQEHPQRIDNAYLRRFEEFQDFLNRSKTETAEAPQAKPPSASSHTPKEMIETGYASLRAVVETEILAHINNCSPEFFERLVVHLLTTMGYGGSRPDAGRAIGRSGDGGVDGAIKEDKLGIDRIYIQAKRWGTWGHMGAHGGHMGTAWGTWGQPESLSEIDFSVLASGRRMSIRIANGPPSGWTRRFRGQNRRASGSEIVHISFLRQAPDLHP